MKPGLPARGFTLIELLVAVSILAVVSAMAYTGLIRVENTQHRVVAKENRLSQIQMTFLNFARDLQQVVHRPIRNRYGTREPSIEGQGQGEYLLALTRGGLRNPAHVARSSLQRVAYIVEDDKLERLYWLVLDQAQDSVPVKQVLLKNISSIEIRFLDQAGEWNTDWPSLASTTSDNGGPIPDNFPRAVSVKLKLPDVGTIQRIFLLPEG
ncbi:MAG: type II secretion system minor pseudopilin GspJ [Gammaproteobacteria bacterium]|jgi:general secretion pathway protein J